MRFFLLALFVVMMCPDVMHAMTRDAASKICQSSVDRLKAEKVVFPPNIQGSYNAILENLEILSQRLRILEKPSDIGDARKNCDRGVRAAEWIIETFGKPGPVRVEDENQENKAAKEKSDKSDEKDDKREKSIKANDEIDKKPAKDQEKEEKKENSSQSQNNSKQEIKYDANTKRNEKTPTSPSSKSA